MITNTNEIIVMNFIKLSVWWFQWKMESSEHKIKKLDAPKTKANLCRNITKLVHYIQMYDTSRPLSTNVDHVAYSYPYIKTCSSYVISTMHVTRAIICSSV
jgi:hypothetical protein